jgi:hypothetical protein
MYYTTGQKNAITASISKTPAKAYVMNDYVSGFDHDDPATCLMLILF